MKTPTVKQIDEMRKQKYRPVVVGVFIYKDEVLFVYNEKYDLWQLPQGGIDNTETVPQAVIREMKEELGSEFLEGVEIAKEVIGEYRIDFPKNLHGSRKVATDAGEEVVMQGKHYYFSILKASKRELDVRKSEFDAYEWVSISDTKEILDKMYQKSKKEMTEKVIDLIVKNQSELYNSNELLT